MPEPLLKRVLAVWGCILRKSQASLVVWEPVWPLADFLALPGDPTDIYDWGIPIKCSGLLRKGHEVETKKGRYIGR